MSNLMRLACLGALIASHTWAQRYSFKRYGPEHGLKAVAVNCLAQDVAGYFRRPSLVIISL